LKTTNALYKEFYKTTNDSEKGFEELIEIQLIQSLFIDFKKAEHRV